MLSCQCAMKSKHLETTTQEPEPCISLVGHGLFCVLVMSLIGDAWVMEQPCLVSGLNRTSFCVLCILGSEGSVNSSNCSFSTSDKSQNMKVKINKSWDDSMEDCWEFHVLQYNGPSDVGCYLRIFQITLSNTWDLPALFPYGCRKRSLRVSALLLKSCHLHLCLWPHWVKGLSRQLQTRGRYPLIEC